MFAIYKTKDGIKSLYITSKRLQQCLEMARELEDGEGATVTIESNGAEDPKVYYKTKEESHA